MNTLGLAQTTPAFDTATAEAFSARVAEMINSSAITLMLSVGHRSGLFDRMASLPPNTSAEIAKSAGLAERYVREWLAVMVVGGIVDYDPDRRTYSLPAEHAASLTRDAALGNMAVAAQFVKLAGSVEDRLLDCFATGAGLPYDAYDGFHHFMAEDSGQTVVAGLFDSILPLVPGLDARLRDGIEALDAGCGRGRALIAMACRYPASRFTGYDLCPDAIEDACAAAAEAGLANVRFEARDLSDFDEQARYDFVTTFDAVHDQKDPQALLHSLHRALRPDGVYLMQDIGASAHLENNLDFPMAAFLYTASCTHCTPVSLAQGGEGLGTMWGVETAERMLRMAGFANVQRHRLAHDPLNVWFVSQKH